MALVLRRRVGERVLIGGDVAIEVTAVEIGKEGPSATLSIVAPKRMRISRSDYGPQEHREQQRRRSE